MLTLDQVKTFVRSWIHIPYFPSFHRPGWLLRYLVGPYDHHWATGIFSDFGAGLTVALTLVPQGLSYSKLANLPPINGLCKSLIPRM
jgi:MFS superfamily sulfate permease-like transporter